MTTDTNPYQATDLGEERVAEHGLLADHHPGWFARIAVGCSAVLWASMFVLIMPPVTSPLESGPFVTITVIGCLFGYRTRDRKWTWLYVACNLLPGVIGVLIS